MPIDVEVLEYVKRGYTYLPAFPLTPTRWEETCEIKITRKIHRQRATELRDAYRLMKADRFPLACCHLARAAIHIMLQLHMQHGDSTAGCSIFLLESLDGPLDPSKSKPTAQRWHETIDIFKSILAAADLAIIFDDPLGSDGPEHYPGESAELQHQFTRFAAHAESLLNDPVLVA